MKQIFRRVIDRSGKIVLDDIPTPQCGENQALVSTEYSLISSGTELSTLKKTPVALAKQAIEDPWMRNAVMSTVKSGGLETTYHRIVDELFLYRIIGYSGVGKVLETGDNITAVSPGDRVAFAAQGHAEIVAPYKNHIVKVPDSVNPEEASFVTVGGIAIQGIRRANPKFGEFVTVIGMGLVGQITAQILLAAGMRVIAVDISKERLELAESLGVQYTVNPREVNPVDSVINISNGQGADKVIICAASKDSSIANQAMQMSRKQGRVVAVGIVKMDLERMPFFQNELDFVFSRAYGPGSYNAEYEKGRIDLPYEYVRWTEQRNLAEFIRLLDEKRINIKPLIAKVFELNEVQEAFDGIKNGKLKGIAALIKYDHENVSKETKIVKKSAKKSADGATKLGIIGTGNHSRGIMLPLFAKEKEVEIKALCSSTGSTASSISDRYKVDYVTSDYKEILSNPDIDAVYAATRHDTHAEIVTAALNAGKHVLVEKPMGMTTEELKTIQEAAKDTDLVCAVCHNRRYSKLFQQLKGYLSGGPIIARYTVAVGRIPNSHWTLDSKEGGGRLVGEADHFFDIFTALIQSKPVDISANFLAPENNSKSALYNFLVQVSYENGSMAHLTYTGLGHPSLPREQLEVFEDNAYYKLTDYKELYAPAQLKKPAKIITGDMGHATLTNEFFKAIRGENNSLATFSEGWQASNIAATAQESLVQAKSINNAEELAQASNAI